MRLDRLPYDPGSVLAFYEEGLSALGALCERTWHDRLEVVAEGRAAKLWDAAGDLYSCELHFAPADASAARDALRQVFPGSPLTFKLAETLRPALAMERLVLSWATPAVPPDAATLEKHWRSQFPNTARWSMSKAPTSTWHFSLLALARIEVQAIDQHWFLHRVAMALPSGERDDHLARELDFAVMDGEGADSLPWPAIQAGLCSKLVSAALQEEISPDLSVIEPRQQASLRRELERVDAYFEHYAAELESRSGRSGSQNVRIKTAERLAAAKSEHARRRTDQVARHEIRIVPHIDALLLIAEKAWLVTLQVEHGRESEKLDGVYVRRSRRWHR